MGSCLNVGKAYLEAVMGSEEDAGQILVEPFHMLAAHKLGPLKSTGRKGKRIRRTPGEQSGHPP